MAMDKFDIEDAAIPQEQDDPRFLAETAYRHAEVGYQRGEAPRSTLRLAGIALKYAKRGQRVPSVSTLNKRCEELGI